MQPGSREPEAALGGADRWFWHAHTPETPAIICAVLELGGDLVVEDARRVIAERLEVVSRLRCRVVEGALRARWAPEDDFDIAAHVRAGELESEDNPTLWKRVEALAAEPLDPRRSPWCFDLLQRPGRGSVLVARLHHALGDGVALMMVLLAFTDPPADAAGPLGIEEGQNPMAMLFDGHERGPELARRYIEELMPGARQLLLRGLGVPRWLMPFIGGKAVVESTAFVLGRDDPKTFKGPRVAARRVAWSDGASLDTLKELSHSLDVTINDLLLTALSGALRRHVVEVKGQAPRDIRVGVPINLRTIERMVDLGNRIGMIYIPLPLEAETPEARLGEVRRRMHKLKRSGQPLGAFATMALVGSGPAGLSKFLGTIVDRKATAIMTNVPGPTRTLTFAGRPIDNLVFWVPTTSLGLGISIMSYAGRVRVGLMSAPTSVAEPSALAELFDEELATLSTLRASG